MKSWHKPRQAASVLQQLALSSSLTKRKQAEPQGFTPKPNEALADAFLRVQGLPKASCPLALAKLAAHHSMTVVGIKATYGIWLRSQALVA